MTKPETQHALTREQASAVLAAWLGDGVVCSGVERLHGGMINSVLRLHFDRAPFTAVIKLSAKPDEAVFVAEQHALDFLRATTAFPCPQVYLRGGPLDAVPFRFLLIETLPGVNLPQADLTAPDRERVDCELAEALLELHSHTRDTFGGIREAGHAHWTDVFVPRLCALQQEMTTRLPDEVLADIERAVAAAPDVLSQQGRPTLVHGDIWAANVMVDRREDGWHLSGLVDPGAQYADVEYELAYLEVFSTVTPAFFRAYAGHNPFRPGYEFRRLFYWLNTYMIHVWIFGDQHYRDMTAAVARAIAQGV
ncbi:MAG: fructosamine kinase family protein [Candidatus Hydrogenedentes bacterium]|nr:fructosamine kinase family protein [Candidatus Hydrogenedentota bacterium]